jgi:hypothetical protein
LALRALIVKHIADVTATAIGDRRKDLAAELVNGDRINVSAPDDPDLDMGHVLRTRPKGTAGITDREAFTDWMAKQYPDHVQTVQRITPGREADALAILADVAPDLVTSTTEVCDWAQAEVLRCTVKARQACGPGRELDVPGVAYEPPKPGAVTVNLSADGPEAIEELWRQGRIDLTTGEVLALPAGEAT